MLPAFVSAQNFYVGTDLSHMTLKQPEFDSVNVVSILAGYELNSWAVEGSVNLSKTHNDFYNGDQEIDMYHLYGVYRSQGTLYYKLKLGVSNERYKFYDENNTLKLNDTHTGLARGVGAGYQYGKFNFEVEYSWLGRSLETVGVGVKYKF